MDYRINHQNLESTIENLKSELAATQARLFSSEKMSVLGRMACSIAHEIKTPLATIYLKTELLEHALHKENIDKRKMQKIILDIHNVSERISKIISGIKTYSRDASIDPAQIYPLRVVLDDTLALCTTRISDAGIAFYAANIPLDWKVRCNPTQMCQVIVNLLDNAIDAVSASQEKLVEISVLNLDNTFRISIIDNGPGVPDHLLNKIMDPFFTTKEPGKGTGLGLSISKEIVEWHHGQITHERIGSKTIFSIILPRVE